jgi:hypothetical protein
MDNQQVQKAVDEIRAALSDSHGNYLNPIRNTNATMISDRVRHLLWMCDQITDFLKNDRIEKAMRWLGFLQGCCWMLNISSIEELKAQNAPSGTVLDKDRV